MRADIDPYSLRLFLAVCEEGSIVRCADREATVPSAVSKRMAALEALMGLPLLRRGPRGMEPTDAGQSLARHAREVLAGMERLRSAMDALVQGGEGSVRILASLAAISSHLTADLVPVLARHRSLKVSLEEQPSAEMVRQVREGSADLAVCWDAADLAGLETLPYRTDHACMVAARGHPLAARSSVRFADILDCDYVSAMPGSMMETMLRRHAAVLGKRLAPRIEIQSFEGVVRAVAAGLGVSVLPREVVEPWLGMHAVRLVPLSDDWAERRFVVCRRAAPYASKAAQLVAEALSGAARCGPLE